MKTWYFHPPIYHSLSDNVIGKVVQRARSFRERLLFNINEASSSHPDYRRPRLLSFKEIPIESQTQGDINPGTTEWSDLSINNTRKRSRLFEDTDDSVATQDAEPVLHVVPDDQRSIPARERRRLKQIRYRTKKRKLAMEREEDIQSLRDEIQDLEQRRHKYSFTRTVWDVATEYFHLFRRGSVPKALRSYAKRFLQQSMESDMNGGLVRGHESLRKAWERFSVLFDSFDVQLQRLDKIGADFLLATITISFTISDKAVRQVISHFNTNKKGDGTGGEWSVLAAKLLGQRIVMCGSVHFEWDNVYGRVVSMQSEVDLLTPLLHLLGSLEDASRVLDLISACCW
ncbi:hypothetical protein PC123_g23348 [Phytophthora cactorum]|nr:hypothetical protein PC123_g23348 [Phytophthora cactorum]